MTLRKRLADRVEFAAGIMELATFLIANPKAAELLADATPTMTFSVASKAEADEIIEAYEGAHPVWRNGYYMAEWTPPPVAPERASAMFRGLSPELGAILNGSPPDVDAFTVELHFAPLITEESGVIMRAANGES